MPNPALKRILIVAGSDSSGGAGIQADIKTVAAFGGYASTAVTAVTVQDTLAVHGVFPVPPALVAAQMRAVLADIGADAIKTGMLVDAATLHAVAQMLAEKAAGMVVVVDPVLRASSGNPLLQAEAIAALKHQLIPRATLLTPNLPEAEALLGISIPDSAAMAHAAAQLGQLGARAVLLKGGHGSGETLTDVLWYNHKIHRFTAPRRATRHTHGTGCTLATACACLLAQGQGMVEAVTVAHAYVQGAIRHAPQLGKGHGPLNHGWQHHILRFLRNAEKN